MDKGDNSGKNRYGPPFLSFTCACEKPVYIVIVLWLLYFYILELFTYALCCSHAERLIYDSHLWTLAILAERADTVAMVVAAPLLMHYACVKRL